MARTFAASVPDIMVSLPLHIYSFNFGCKHTNLFANIHSKINSFLCSFFLMDPFVERLSVLRGAPSLYKHVINPLKSKSKVCRSARTASFKKSGKIGFTDSRYIPKSSVLVRRRSEVTSLTWRRFDGTQTIFVDTLTAHLIAYDSKLICRLQVTSTLSTKHHLWTILLPSPLERRLSLWKAKCVGLLVELRKAPG
jgi:hypothetical protein